MTDKKYKVIDNYLSHDDFKKLKDIIFNTEFPWYHNENIVTDDELLKDLNGIPFYYQVHLIYQDNKPNSTFYVSLPHTGNPFDQPSFLTIYLSSDARFSE